MIYFFPDLSGGKREFSYREAKLSCNMMDARLRNVQDTSFNLKSMIQHYVQEIDYLKPFSNYQESYSANIVIPDTETGPVLPVCERKSTANKNNFTGEREILGGGGGTVPDDGSAA